MIDIAIGIDPGVNTGYAVWDCKEQKFIELETLDFWDCYYTVLARNKMSGPVLVVIEDPSQNSPVWHGKGQKINVRLNIAQRVGSNKREAELLIEGFENEGILVRRVRPTQSKWNAKTFKNMTGYKGRTNEHKRDAGRLVFGMKPINKKQLQ